MTATDPTVAASQSRQREWLQSQGTTRLRTLYAGAWDCSDLGRMVEYGRELLRRGLAPSGRTAEDFAGYVDRVEAAYRRG